MEESGRSGRERLEDGRTEEWKSGREGKGGEGGDEEMRG
jgi:hypothetical protein